MSAMNSPEPEPILQEKDKLRLLRRATGRVFRCVNECLRRNCEKAFI